MSNPEMDQQVTTKLDELATLVTGNATQFTFSVSVDAGGKTYSQSVTDVSGNTTTIQQRLVATSANTQAAPIVTTVTTTPAPVAIATPAQ